MHQKPIMMQVKQAEVAVLCELAFIIDCVQRRTNFGRSFLK